LKDLKKSRRRIIRKIVKRKSDNSLNKKHGKIQNKQSIKDQLDSACIKGINSQPGSQKIIPLLQSRFKLE
jgi:flagellar basal body-associated protein FliL